MSEETIETGVEAIEPNAANPLAEQVYQRLKTDIFNFRLFPGDRFSENGIAQYYGVSRTPMRDGLFRRPFSSAGAQRGGGLGVARR